MARDPNKPVMVAKAAYLGGLPGDKGSEKLFLPLIASPEAVGHNVRKRDRMTNWTDIEGVSFDSGTMAKSRAGKAVAFGIFAILAKNTQDDGNLTILRKDGNVVIFHVKGMSGHALRARLQPYLTEAGVPCLDDQPTPTHPPSPPVSAADEIAKLASLHDSGVLTDEEFVAHKAKLLDG